MKILVAEDDAVSRRILESTLRQWGYEVVSTKDGQEAWEVLQSKDAPRLAILDWIMPQRDGIEICRQLRKASAEPYTYVLLLTSKGEKEDLIMAMDAGADDYITKPFDPHELQVRLRAGARIITLQEELIAAREALRIQATRDPLTGLWNRAAVLDILRRELARGQREFSPVGLLMADIDHFKRINDSYGHMAGDAVLREVASRMVSSVRPYDAVGRYGGEEFLIILPGCDETGILNAGERLRGRISDEPVDLAEAIVAVTISLGMTVGDGLKPVDSESLIQTADIALYLAKARGRNRAEFATHAKPAKDALVSNNP